MDEARVRVWGVAAAREDIKDGDSVARSKPIGNSDRERKGCIVAVRGEDEDLQVWLQMLSSYFTGM
jgi:hypothetical protein